MVHTRKIMRKQTMCPSCDVCLHICSCPPRQPPRPPHTIVGCATLAAVAPACVSLRSLILPPTWRPRAPQSCRSCSSKCCFWAIRVSWRRVSQTGCAHAPPPHHPSSTSSAVSPASSSRIDDIIVNLVMFDSLRSDGSTPWHHCRSTTAPSPSSRFCYSSAPPPSTCSGPALLLQLA